MFGIFGTNLIIHFGLHSREVECRYALQLGQSSTSHDLHDYATRIQVMNKVSWEYPRSSKIQPVHEVNAQRISLGNEFNKAMTASIGIDWLKEWSEQSLYGHKWPVLRSYLEFAILHGMFFYARDIIETMSSAQLQAIGVASLFWTLASCELMEEDSVLGLWRDEAQRCHEFSRYLIQKGADVNAKVAIPFQQTVYTPDIPFQQAVSTDISFSGISHEPKNGIADVTVLHYALGIAMKEGFKSELGMAALEMICILVESSADIQETMYENYWELRREPYMRSALHYLSFPTATKTVWPSGPVHIEDPFQMPEVGPLLCRTIKTLLRYGADPNAVDSAGVDVLTSLTTSCPYDVIEYALEMGAQISPRLLDSKGLLPQGILSEDRWKKPEYFTPEARDIVRKHMPHWQTT
jgi:hypothetical protein